MTLHKFSEDELVSLDELQEKIQELEDYIQSTDVAAMQSKSSIAWSSGTVLTDLPEPPQNCNGQESTPLAHRTLMNLFLKFTI